MGTHPLVQLLRVVAILATLAASVLGVEHHADAAQIAGAVAIAAAGLQARRPGDVAGQ